MNTLSYQTFFHAAPAPPQTNLDWLELPWGGPYREEEEDVPIALCGSWDCSGDCEACFDAELKLRGVTLVPIQGPVNRDGIPLGFLLVTG